MRSDRRKIGVLGGIVMTALMGACSLAVTPTPQSTVSPSPGTTASPSASPADNPSPNPSPSMVAPPGEIKLTRGAQCEEGSVWALPKDEVIAVAPCPPPESQPPYIQPAATHQMSESERAQAQIQYNNLSFAAAPDLLGSLTPDRPIAAGTRIQCPSGEGVVPIGGLLGSCREYAVAEAGQNFRLFKDPSVFQAYFAPIETPAEAASYALARSGAEWKSEFPELKESFRYYTRLIRRSRVETKADGYEVLLYAYAQFGCGPHNHYAVTYKVGRDGSLSESSRQQAWADPMYDGLCVD